MGLFDYFTTCDKPFNPGYDWELAVPPLGLPGFEWLGGEDELGWVAGACHEWTWRMWAIKKNGSVIHSGELYRHPKTDQVFWTYFGAPEGSKVTDPSATPFVEDAEAYGFVFAAREAQPEPSPDPDEPAPKKEKRAGLSWFLGLLGLGAVVTVIVSKKMPKKGSR